MTPLIVSRTNLRKINSVQNTVARICEAVGLTRTEVEVHPEDANIKEIIDLTSEKLDIILTDLSCIEKQLTDKKISNSNAVTTMTHKLSKET